MGKHKGQAKKDWAEAVTSAANAAGQPGDYTLTTEVSNQDAKGGLAPIREYTVTLDGPK